MMRWASMIAWLNTARGSGRAAKPASGSSILCGSCPWSMSSSSLVRPRRPIIRLCTAVLTRGGTCSGLEEGNRTWRRRTRYARRTSQIRSILSTGSLPWRVDWMSGTSARRRRRTLAFCSDSLSWVRVA